MYGVIIKESKGNFIPYVYKHFPNTDRGYLVKNFNDAGIGVITSEEFLKNLGFDEIKNNEIDYLNNHLTYDMDFTGFAVEHKKMYKLALLSNDVSEWNKHLVKHHKIAEYFDLSVVSGDVGCRKPDRMIYEIILEKLDQPAQECVFIDNSVKNLRVASELGMDTILFNSDNEQYEGKIVYSFKELTDILNNLLVSRCTD